MSWSIFTSGGALKTAAQSVGFGASSNLAVRPIRLA